MKAILKSECGSPVPAPSNEGMETAGTESEQNSIKVCPHPNAGCISENAGRCFLGGPCDPCNANGSRFTVSYSYVGGQRFMHKHYAVRVRPAGPVIDAEEEQRKNLAALLARQDERLPTWRFRGCTISEEPCDRTADREACRIDAAYEAGRDAA